MFLEQRGLFDLEVWETYAAPGLHHATPALVLAELGVAALKGTPFAELLDRTAQLVAQGLEADFCKVLEFQPLEHRFLVVAGVGWARWKDSPLKAAVSRNRLIMTAGSPRDMSRVPAGTMTSPE